MATNGESKTGPKRVRRTARKSTTPAEPSMLDEEGVVVRDGDAAAPSVRANRGGVRYSDITTFLRQLIMLLDAGTPILKSLQTLSTRGQRAGARALVADIAQYVEGGNPLWQAFDRHPRYFDTIFVNLIKASEASGTLTTVLRRVTQYREKRELLTKRVRGAMVYPVVLVAACIAVMLLISTWVVPEFRSMFQSANITYGTSTKVFFALSDLFRYWWWLPIVVLIALIVVYKAWYVRSPLRRLAADRIKIKIPIMGPIVHKNAIVELTRTMALLLRSGLSMMATLELTRNAVRNRAVAQSLQGVRDSIEQGGGLEEPLRRASAVIPPVVTDMFVTGEEAGQVDVIADQIADVYEEEVSIAVDTIGDAMQPVFTIFVGIGVAILFIALFNPMVAMITSLTSGNV